MKKKNEIFFVDIFVILYYYYSTKLRKMKTISVITFIGGSAFITTLTTWVGITPTIELKMLIFIDILVLLALLLRKHLNFSAWLFSEKESSIAEGTEFSNTSRFITVCLGLKKLSPEEFRREKVNGKEIL